jgi:predicted  nucleic acid-binding Zn-ribbon protein
MTTSADDSQGPGDDTAAALERVDAERAELQREIESLHAEVSDEGPMDAADRASLLSQVEELERVLSSLDERRERLREDLDRSS